ncbi:MAG: hypothetical protein AAF826_01470 [Pseudomonadota bacterium]
MGNMHGRLYFRTRENGAAVFRIDTENKSRRLEMIPIASVSLRKAEIRSQGPNEITDAERAEIQDWITSRKAELAERTSISQNQLLDDIKFFTHWINSQATPDQVVEMSEEFLLTIHDLRASIVRAQAESLIKKDQSEAPSSS